MESNVSETLKEIVIKSGLTQEDFAASIGLKKAAFNNYVHGRRDLPNTVIDKMMQVHKINPAIFFNSSAPMYIYDINQSDELKNVYEKLNEENKAIVFDFATKKLKEQTRNSSTKFNSLDEYRKKVPDAIDTLAAHSPDRKKKYTDQEIENMKDILDSMIEEHINNNNK